MTDFLEDLQHFSITWKIVVVLDTTRNRRRDVFLAGDDECRKFYGCKRRLLRIHHHLTR